jgi:hypothetical protein
MLDGAAHSPGVEELAREIDGRTVAVARVRRACTCTHCSPSSNPCELIPYPRRSLLWGIAAGFLGAYAILLDLNVPLILQPQLFGFFSLLSWGQVYPPLGSFK